MSLIIKFTKNLLILFILIFSVFGSYTIANEQALRKKIVKKLGEVKIHSVKKTPFADLYEVFINDRLHYMDEDFSFMIIGSLIDINNNINYSNQSLRKLTSVRLSLLPSKDLALHVQKAKNVENSKINIQELYLFTDPLCPQCQDFEQVLANFPQLDIYVYLLPNDAVNRGSTRMASAIWCAQNPEKAYLDFMRKKIIPSGRIRAQCKLPVQAVRDSAQNIGLQGTPAMVFSDGFPYFGKIDEGHLRSFLRDNPLNKKN